VAKSVFLWENNVMLDSKKLGLQFQIRPATLQDARDIAATHVASWVNAYQGIIPNEVLAQQAVEKRLAQWNALLPALRIYPDRQTALVGVHPDSSVRGFIHGGIDREAKSAFDAEVYSLYLHPDVQGMGLGSRMLGHMTDWLMEHGHRTLRLWVLEENPWRAFYERIGGTLLPETQDIYFGDHGTRQVSYGWERIDGLSANLPR